MMTHCCSEAPDFVGLVGWDWTVLGQLEVWHSWQGIGLGSRYATELHWQTPPLEYHRHYLVVTLPCAGAVSVTDTSPA
jgi:hypothetical protein